MIQLVDTQFFACVKINVIKTTRDCCDEWVTAASFDFLLHQSKTAEISIFGDKSRIVGVRLCNCDWYDDQFCLEYLRQTNPNEESMIPISGLIVSESLAKELHAILADEEKNKKGGWLKNHTFSDDEGLWDGYDICISPEEDQ